MPVVGEIPGGLGFDEGVGGGGAVEEDALFGFARRGLGFDGRFLSGGARGLEFFDAESAALWRGGGEEEDLLDAGGVEGIAGLVAVVVAEDDLEGLGLSGLEPRLLSVPRVVLVDRSGVLVDPRVEAEGGLADVGDLQLDAPPRGEIPELLLGLDRHPGIVLRPLGKTNLEVPALKHRHRDRRVRLLDRHLSRRLHEKLGRNRRFGEETTKRGEGGYHRQTKVHIGSFNWLKRIDPTA